MKADGSTGGFTMVSPGPAAVGVAIVRAVHECKWLPGGYVPGPCSDPLDRAAAVTMPTWVVQPIRFAGP